ncbi:ATP-dependent Clp protease adapter ClpS [Flaviflexus salsibiostraticola]|uniref:ATP-dependent Clp protease adapter protein ClpS n=1 Tax=Flaviflexus salsibiostraticola TaxID=1282737 RepID=A0A3Q8WT03_9ACTO|nr:ATP-dependent Clp protease adapter ClpS [Flaviflexus salsibiostraticola]AZN29624.1 ATP-dependent Clp protease adapter ClpS [Flaviflexus salsibiostraticola]
MTQPTSSPAPSEEQTSAPSWRTVVHDDPINLMSYVAWVFESYFGFDAMTANRLMMEVHTRGRAVVSSGSREAMETDVQAMHTYGLLATIEGDS